MSKEIVFEITINGQSIHQCNSLALKQSFNAHHEFELILDQDALDELGSHDLEHSQEYIGTNITISFGEKQTDNTFKGIVTEVELDQREGAWGCLIVKGYSPSYLMESGANYASYEQLTLKDLVNTCLKNTTAADIELNANPVNKDTIEYICQYGESGFAFINRLSAEYGEWFYYDGTKLFFGKPSSQKSIDLIYGRHISAMKFSVQVVPSSINHFSYKSTDNTFLTASLPSQVAGATSYAQKAVKISNDLYPIPVKQHSAIRICDRSSLDTYTKTHKAKLAASTVLLKASSDNPEITVGCFVTIKVPKTTGIGYDDKGEFIITSISHALTGTGSYSNTIEAIPSSNSVIPFEVPRPLAQTQMAIVTDNDDPERMGRIRVQMLWQQDSPQKTNWLRVLTSDAGGTDAVSKNRGYVFIPEVGDQVLISFRYNDPNRPFVLGSLFHGNTAEGGGPENNLKAIKTRSGHTLQFNDANGHESITITDKNNNIIILDTSSSSITISAPENISIMAKNIDITAKETLSMTAGTDISSSAKENITVSAGENLTQHAGKDASLAAKNIFTQAQENLTRDAKNISDTGQEISANSTHKDMKLASGKKVNMQSGEKVKLF
ncbi:MAG: hypothetical protein H7259_03050 [Cytophagales bacterium]|nr:hypothetical protein [Cytophaga sp.]